MTRKAGGEGAADRVPVTKTYKMYVKGAFVRSESGRVFAQEDRRGRVRANVAWASRKDLRDAVRAAREAQGGWARRSPFQRSQVLFRVAEMLEDRRRIFEERLRDLASLAPREAAADLDAAVDRVFWYAGWADKFAQVLGGANPVAAPYFNVTLPEPAGVVGILAPVRSPLVGLVSAILPPLVPGSACVVVVDAAGAPAIALDFAEVLATSDLPAGVVNLLPGRRAELHEVLAAHMDVDAIALFGGEDGERAAVRAAASSNVKRVAVFDDPAPARWRDRSMQSPYRIESFVEWKTCWHPIGV